MMKSNLEKLQFDNRFIEQLPADQETANKCRQVKSACYSFVKPKQTAQPELLAYSTEVADLLDLNKADCETELFTKIFTGNELLADMNSYATCYGGHQFGNWAGQLGDGRAINLGEIVNQQNQRWALQLKGAGPTPYSRHSDGLAVLRSSLREFLCSEAMYHLGVPTTRALSLCLSGDSVLRDMFYDGHPKNEPGAIVCRVAPSFTRFGHFQILAAQGDNEALQRLIDYTITTDFPHLGEPSESVYVKWFEEICQLTKTMVVHWMRIGFVHGVMNTDNMSILGLTIDYGPYGWLEGYDENWTPNTTDAEGKRYRYGAQAVIAHWNLAQLARAIAPIFTDLQPLQNSLDNFCTDYESDWHQMMLTKLGLGKIAKDDDKKMLTELAEMLQLVETDMSIFYRRLADLNVSEYSAWDKKKLPNILLDAYYSPDDIPDDVIWQTNQWLEHYAKRAMLELDDGDLSQSKLSESLVARKISMNSINPKYVMRNYVAQLAIDKSEKGDHSLLNELLEVMRHPYDEQPENEQYALKRPEWARHKAGCSMLSCSS